MKAAQESGYVVHFIVGQVGAEMPAHPVEMHRGGCPQAFHSLFGQDGVYHAAIRGGRFPPHET